MTRPAVDQSAAVTYSRPAVFAESFFMIISFCVRNFRFYIIDNRVIVAARSYFPYAPRSYFYFILFRCV